MDSVKSPTAAGIRHPGLAALILFALTGLGLAAAVGLAYSYSSLTAIEAAAGLGILLLTTIFVWLYRRRSNSAGRGLLANQSSAAGLAIGALWVIEISINNFLAPPLPARDQIDNLFWAAVALAILVFAGFQAFSRNSIRQGIQAGAWSGLASGLVACFMALAVIVFAMHYITQDPLNIAEWALRGAAEQAPGMAAYFAFETFAGAFLHLLVLGVLMGAILGLVGGLVGKGIKKIPRVH